MKTLAGVQKCTEGGGKSKNALHSIERIRPPHPQSTFTSGSMQHRWCRTVMSGTTGSQLPNNNKRKRRDGKQQDKGKLTMHTHRKPEGDPAGGINMPPKVELRSMLRPMQTPHKRRSRTRQQKLAWFHAGKMPTNVTVD